MLESIIVVEYCVSQYTVDEYPKIIRLQKHIFRAWLLA